MLAIHTTGFSVFQMQLICYLYHLYSSSTFTEIFVYVQCLSTFRRYFAMPAGYLIHHSEIFLEVLRWSRYVIS